MDQEHHRRPFGPVSDGRGEKAPELQSVSGAQGNRPHWCEAPTIEGRTRNEQQQGHAGLAVVQEVARRPIVHVELYRPDPPCLIAAHDRDLAWSSTAKNVEV